MSKVKSVRFPNIFLLPLLAVFLLGICGVSCNTSQSHDDVYYDTLFEHTFIGPNNRAKEHSIEKADSLFAKTLHPSAYLRFKMFQIKGHYHFEHDSLDSSRIYLDSQILVMEQSRLTEKYPDVYAAILGDRGNYYFTENNLQKAYEYYSRSKAVQLTMKEDKCMLSFQSYHLGMITYRQEKFPEAAEYFKQAFHEAEHCFADSHSYMRMQEMLNNAALSYSKAGVTDSAASYYTYALNYIDTEGAKYSYNKKYSYLSEVARGVVLGNMAKVYVATGKVDSAEHLLLQSIAINGRQGYDNTDALFASIQLAELYSNSGKFDKALPVLKHIEGKLHNMPNLAISLRWNKLMYAWSSHANKLAKAIKYLETYQQLKDSADKELSNIKKIDYTSVIKDREIQFQIKLLKKDNQLNKLYLWLTIGLTFIALLIIAFIYYVYMKSARNVQQLTSLNMQISEQKVQLEEAMVQLKYNNEDKDRILRVVAHDLRTPINGILMLGDYMLDEEEDDVKRESLNMVITASKNLLHLTNELLEFSGNNRLITKAEREDTEINELGRQVIGLLQFKAGEKKQKIVLLPSAEPVYLSVYREKISRVLSNLITNAIKFSQEGSEIKVAIDKQPDSTLIKVTDSGIGIPANMLSIVFDTFTNAKRHGTAGERSYGLGLSICKQIIEAHNGRIWVESTEGKGSTFFIELPL